MAVGSLVISTTSFTVKFAALSRRVSESVSPLDLLTMNFVEVSHFETKSSAMPLVELLLLVTSTNFESISVVPL